MVCREYMTLAIAKRPIRLGIQGRGRYIDQFPTRPADCTRGICYRVPLSYRVFARIGSESSASGFVELPNESPPCLSISTERSRLRRSRTSISMKRAVGCKRSSSRNQARSRAVAKLPLEIEGRLSSPTELIQLRVALVGQQTALATKTAELAAAQNALSSQQDKRLWLSPRNQSRGIHRRARQRCRHQAKLVLSVVNASQLAVVPLQ